ncbi:hypothetical protein TBR22_A16750 [Luteitalea sp. TBR-22]|uniref:M56 family metallopeptidase n=1 Tax=Luteitalea sp. TBR-22 TaxID=2802971 RepID=UPI001EF411DE|nr:M56 family metallopeptidase [Luteitalea sp. TBR-22]BCS32460.2 hypothetical protein TBR22_A16750 [Luteitalea sp. TBR-22]
MTSTLLDSFAPFLAGLLVKATLVVAIAALVQGLARRWLSAAGRHLVTLVATSMLLALPLLSLALPRWAPTMPERAAALMPARQSQASTLDVALADLVDRSVGLQPLETVKSTVSREAASTPVPVEPVARLSWRAAGVAFYLAGVSAMVVHLLVQRRRVRRLAREARAVDDPSWLTLVADGARVLGVRRSVRTLRGRRSTMPMTFGTIRPAILLPVTADTWTDDRRRAVILHELAHVARADCFTQWVACVMRAVYWCHPGAWWLVGRLQVDSEFASDDLVLAAGTPARAYAGHLLDIAYAHGGGRAPAVAVPMARRSQIETRLRALLDDSRRRRGPSRPARLATTAGAFAVLLPLASATQPAAPAPTVAAPAPVVAASAPTPVSTPAVPRVAMPVTTPMHVATPMVAPSPAVAAMQTPAPAPVVARSPAPTGSAGGCTWEVGEGKEGALYLSMQFGRSQSGRSVPLQQFEGLTTTQLTTGGSVRFTIRRDAGTFTFEGVARSGAAAGVCSFAPSPTFGPELARRGITGLTAADQEQMARHDVGLALVDELRTQKYATPTVAELVKAGQHGVHVAYVRGMGALGYATGSIGPLIALRDHGVTPDYAQALASLGYARLPIDELQRARDHGVTADYVRGMREAGHGTLTLDQLITTRDHGVTAGYLREMKALGIGGSLETLVNARDHGITSSYVRDLGALGVAGPLDTLVRLRDHGVTPNYVEELRKIGYTGLSVDELVRLRDHGMTASRIGQANTRAGSRQSVEALLDGARRGR